MPILCHTGVFFHKIELNFFIIFAHYRSIAQWMVYIGQKYKFINKLSIRAHEIIENPQLIEAAIVHALQKNAKYQKLFSKGSSENHSIPKAFLRSRGTDCPNKKKGSLSKFDIFTLNCRRERCILMA